MKLSQLIDVLGKPVNDEELQNAFSQNTLLNSLQTLKLPGGEYSAYIERPGEGFSLIFTDEAMFLGKAGQTIGSGPLYFTGIFLYAEGKDNYSQYKGDLPLQIHFEKTRDDFVKNFGEPDWQRKRPDGSIAADRWTNIIRIAYTLHTRKRRTLQL